MVDVRPFRGLRFAPAKVANPADVLAPPYDVIEPAEQRELLARSPYNIVRIELPSAEAGDRYDLAAQTLAEWRAAGVLELDSAASFYLHETRFELGGDRVRRALIGALRLQPWEAGQVLPHERTFAGPKEDRLRLLRATRANVSPLWTLYRGNPPSLTRAWTWAENHAPVLSCELDDGTSQRLWALVDSELTDALRADFVDLRLVIADGHHRYETALYYRDEQAAGRALEPDDPANFVLAHLVAEDDPGLAALPSHRLVRDLGQLDHSELETELGSDWHAEYFPVWDDAPPEQLKAFLQQLFNEGETERVVGLYGPDPSIFSILILRNKQLMQQRAPDHSEAWHGLDVALLDEGLLKP